MDYPEARRDENVVDDYHGTPVPDPYRWLEDPDSADTRAFIDAQNALTRAYLDEISAREQIHARLKALWNFSKYDVPTRKGEHLFYQKNDGLQNQPVVYRDDGLEVLDPNSFSADGTAALTTLAFSKDGSKVAYGVSSGGSDWQTVRIRDIEAGTDYDETLEWCKYAGVAWLEDGSGFYYDRFPEPEAGNPESAYYNNAVYFHRLGTPQSDDVLVFNRPDAPELNFRPMLTDDYAYLVLHVWHGSINRSRLYYRAGDDGEVVRLLDEADAMYYFIGNTGSTFYIQTNKDAPNGCIIAIDVDDPGAWHTVLPESEDVLLLTEIVNDHFVAVYMHNAHHLVKLFMLDGTFVREVEMPMMGTIDDISGRREDTDLFISFASYLYPRAVFRYDFTTDTLTPHFKVEVDFPLDDYETTQVFYPSKDGTQVSMFITHKKGLALDGDNPTWLYGYGGFYVAYTPAFHAWVLNWLEMGGVYCVANLRGGSEYGEAWHEAGMLDKKQNVFDDFIAAAEWLIDQRYTRPDKLAIMGRSNGGLLVATCMEQRPDLFGAVVCVVPVTDMLRFHKFTAGRYWVYEYGNAEDNPEHFRFLYAYSPLHNLQPGTAYPPIIITSADGDDRVVPLHALKFTAALQAADGGTNPLLLRMDTQSGHGLGKPTAKWIDEWADIQAFLVRILDVSP